MATYSFDGHRRPSAAADSADPNTNAFTDSYAHSDTDSNTHAYPDAERVDYSDE